MSWPLVRDRPDGCCQQTVSCGAAFMDVQALFNAMKGNSISYVISTNYIGFLQFDYESLFAATISMCVCILQGCVNNVGFMPNLQISRWTWRTGHDRYQGRLVQWQIASLSPCGVQAVLRMHLRTCCRERATYFWHA